MCTERKVLAAAVRAVLHFLTRRQGQKQALLDFWKERPQSMVRVLGGEAIGGARGMKREYLERRLGG